MSITYTAGGGTSKDRIRFAIGDTDPNADVLARLEDEEITDALAFYGPDVLAAAAACADALSAKFVRLAEGSAGPQRIAPMSRAAELRAIAARLRARQAEGCAPVAGGVSSTGPDREAYFTRGRLDHTEAS